LSDSKPLALLLIGFQSHYPAGSQLGLDMLKRLGSENKEIVEILLANEQVIPAIRYAQSVGLGDEISAKKFLETTVKLNDHLVFYNVFKYFEDRNVKLRGSPLFKPDEDCDSFTKHFLENFSNNQQRLIAASGFS
jgi:hypothetical protein